MGCCWHKLLNQTKSKGYDAPSHSERNEGREEGKEEGGKEESKERREEGRIEQNPLLQAFVEITCFQKTIDLGR